ncbi:MAG: hypothetical protein ACC634_09375, partial [Hyphomicrobiales bacterium]
MKIKTALCSITLAATTLMLANAPAFAVSELSVLRMLKSPKTSDKTLESLMGNWRGAGKLRTGSNEKAEATQCRFNNKWAASGKLAYLKLSCRGTEASFTAEGYLGRSGNEYRGAWSTSTGRNAFMSGRRSGSGLRLTLTSSRSADAEKSTLTLRMSGKTINAKLTARDTDTGKTFTAFTTTLK